MLTQQQKAEVNALIDTLLDLSGSARWERWRSLTVSDPAVREEVESFLRSAELVGDFLSHPARPHNGEPTDDLTVGTLLDG